MIAINAIEGPAAYSPEWYELRLFNPERKERPVVFGASEAAIACDQSPYSTPLQLYREKRGEFERTFTAEQERRMEEGRHMERSIIDLYCHRTQAEVKRDLPLYFHPLYSFMGATPDGLREEQQESISIEAKLSNWRMIDAKGQDETKFGAEGTDEVPTIYLIQAQQQMAVLGVNRCDLPAYFDRFAIYRIERNDDLIAAMIDAQKELAERIVNGEPPEPNWEHRETRQVLDAVNGCEIGRKITLGPEVAGFWEEYLRLGEQIKQLETQRRAMQARVLHAMGPAEIGIIEGADFELKRSLVKDSFYTDDDVRETKLLVGKVKRNGYVRLGQRKRKSTR